MRACHAIIHHLSRMFPPTLDRSIRALSLVAALALSAGCSSQLSSAATPPLPANAARTDVAPDVVADSLLVDLSGLAPAPLVQLRYATAGNFTGTPLPGYVANRAFLRREAASAFARASVALASQGYRIKVWDAYRPVRATDAMVAWTQRTGRTDLLRDGYIAERSRHNLGLAVDCTLVDMRTGTELQMGTPFDTFSDRAHTMSATGAELANRLVLRRAMALAGFTPYDAEWWHFAVPINGAPRFNRVIQ